MRYAKIRKMDISNGKGIGVSLFVQGCDFHCQGCFNSETWDFNGGKEFTEETINQIIDLCKPEYITRLSILGGEPFHPYNIETVLKLCVEFKKHYPSKQIWVWTGYTKDKLDRRLINYSLEKDNSYDMAVRNSLRALSYIDYIIDGRFEQDKKDLTLMYRGSSNQRIWKRTIGYNWEDITKEIDEKENCNA